MSSLDPNVVLGVVIGLMVTIIGFFMKREREIATITASLKALHRRIDRLERISNGKYDS